ncbi:unnamed protein product [Peniophora sp. CBMAI 1063]|nr:unnamed protein product [Peniophora sp. CBMAI 1063]
MPTLWGRIALVSAGPPPRAFRTLLRRSQSALLDVELSLRGDHYYDVSHEGYRKLIMGAAKVFVHRLRSLSTIGVEFPLDDIVYFFQRSPLPELQRLHIVHTSEAKPGSLENDVVLDARNLVDASFMLFAYGLPMGSHLKKGLRINAPNLRSLVVKWSYMTNAETTLQDIQWIVDVIRNAPLLERLHLNLSVWHFAVDWDHLFGNKDCHLPQLKTLIITQRSLDMRAGDLIARICTAPPPSFTFTARYIVKPEFQALMDVLDSYLHPCATHSTMYIRFRHPAWVMFHSLPRPEDARELSEEKLFHRRAEDALAKLERQTTLSLSTRSNLVLAEELLPDLALRLRFDHITHLRINGSVNPSGWWRTFREMVAPRMVSVHILIIDNLSWLAPKAGEMNALSILDPRSRDDSTNFGFPLPVLRTLIATAWVASKKGRQRMWTTYLGVLLEEREIRGKPVHTVRLRGGWLTSELKAFWRSYDVPVADLIQAVIVDEVVDEREVFESS